MRIKALFILWILGVMPKVFAQFYPAEAIVRVLPTQITAQVANHYHYPVVCSGYVYGRTAWGLVFNSYFAEQVLRPGEFRYAYVVTNHFQPFVGGWSNILCRQGWW